MLFPRLRLVTAITKSYRCYENVAFKMLRVQTGATYHSILIGRKRYGYSELAGRITQ